LDYEPAFVVLKRSRSTGETNFWALFFILALVSLLINAVAQNYNNGMRSAYAGDFATAVYEWRPLTENGNVYPQTSRPCFHDRDTIHQ
jgi:hypothetical protein